MEVFLSVVLTIVLVVYLLGKFGRLLLTYWINKKMKQFQNGEGNPAGGFYYKTWSNRAEDNQKYSDPNQNGDKEGNINISQDSQEHKGVNKTVGEYVDYEEIK